MKKTFALAALAACALAVGSCGDEPTTPKSFTLYESELAGANEVPPVVATATGTVLVTVNEKNQMSYNVHWMGLSGAATGAHIHGPADEATGGAAVIVNFQTLPAGAIPTGAGNSAYSTSALSGGASGTIKLDNSITYAGVPGDSLKKLLEAGLLYVNVHTTANAAGEVRAQIKLP
jgi:hypothetical protein